MKVSCLKMPFIKSTKTAGWASKNYLTFLVFTHFITTIFVSCFFCWEMQWHKHTTTDVNTQSQNVITPLGGIRLQQRAGWGQSGINKCSWGVQDGSCSRAESICQLCCLVMWEGGCRPPGSHLSITLLRVILKVLHDLTQSLLVLDDPGQRMSPENTSVIVLQTFRNIFWQFCDGEV